MLVRVGSPVAYKQFWEQVVLGLGLELGLELDMIDMMDRIRAVIYYFLWYLSTSCHHMSYKELIVFVLVKVEVAMMAKLVTKHHRQSRILRDNNADDSELSY